MRYLHYIHDIVYVLALRRKNYRFVLHIFSMTKQTRKIIYTVVFFTGEQR